MTDLPFRYIVVDASLWVSRLVPQDTFHPVVSSWIDDHRRIGTEFISPAFLLAETAGAISRRTGNASLAIQAVELLQRLPGLRLVEMDSILLKSAAQLAAQFGLRGADSTYVAVAHRLQIPLVTLDDDQRNRASACVQIIQIS